MFIYVIYIHIYNVIMNTNENTLNYVFSMPNDEISLHYILKSFITYSIDDMRYINVDLIVIAFLCYISNNKATFTNGILKMPLSYISNVETFKIESQPFLDNSTLEEINEIKTVNTQNSYFAFSDKIKYTTTNGVYNIFSNVKYNLCFIFEKKSVNDITPIILKIVIINKNITSEYHYINKITLGSTNIFFINTKKDEPLSNIKDVNYLTNDDYIDEKIKIQIYTDVNCSSIYVSQMSVIKYKKLLFFKKKCSA